MTDITDLLAPKRTTVATPQRAPVRAVVTGPPATLDAPTVRVVVPGHSSDYATDCRWVRQGDALPTEGADCLVVYDETGAGIAVWWAADVLAVGAWTAATLGSGYANFGSGLQVAEYRVISDEVQLRGVITKSSGVASSGDTVVTGLPHPLLVQIGTVSVGQTQIAARLQVSTSGAAQVFFVGTATETDFVSIDARYFTS